MILYHNIMHSRTVVIVMWTFHSCTETIRVNDLGVPPLINSGIRIQLLHNERKAKLIYWSHPLTMTIEKELFAIQKGAPRVINSK